MEMGLVGVQFTRVIRRSHRYRYQARIGGVDANYASAHPVEDRRYDGEHTAFWRRTEHTTDEIDTRHTHAIGSLIRELRSQLSKYQDSRCACPQDPASSSEYGSMLLDKFERELRDRCQLSLDAKAPFTTNNFDGLCCKAQ